MNRFTIRTTDLRPLDPESSTDQACEAERRAAHDFHLRRLSRAEKRADSDAPAIIVGNIVALACLFLAHVRPDTDLNEGVERLHAMLDFAWLQAVSMAEGAHGGSGVIQ